jgi:hypothetical protein
VARERRVRQQIWRAAAHVLLGMVGGLCMQLVSHGDEEAMRRNADVRTKMLDAFLR